MTKGYCTILPNRAGIAVTGADARSFLQGLITQDIGALATAPLLYSALLTPQGRLDFDFFVQAIDNGILLDCDSMRADALIAKLGPYKMRKNVTLTKTALQVYALWGADADLPRDPRHAGLGYRAQNAGDFTPIDFDAYDRHRIGLGVPDGGRDIAWGEDTAADINLEKLNGVSYTKGCYLGQELTSRMHHRALSKRGIYVVTITGEIPPPFTDIIVDGNLIGEMRSSSGHKGLAMLRHDSVTLMSSTGLTVSV